MLVEAVNGLELSLGDLDDILARHFSDGQQVSEMRVGTHAVLHLAHLAEAADAVIQVTAQQEPSGVVTGIAVSGYVHPITGEVVEITHLASDPERIEFHALAA